MKIILQLLVLLPVVWLANFVFTLVSVLFMPFAEFWVTYYAPEILALGIGWLAWKRFGTMEQSVLSNMVLGALILGGTGVAFGVFGTLLFYPRNEQAVLGVFYGFPGVVVGAVLGAIVAKRQTKALDGLLWMCALASVMVVELSQTNSELFESKNSSFIRESSDIEKRDSSLDFLRVRSLPDDELIKLKRFHNLFGLDFESGWASYDAEITDAGLKTLMEMQLPKLVTMRLSHCSKITDEGMKYLAGMTRLLNVGLAACPQITDAGLAMLADSRSIEYIDLRGCTGITDEGLRHLSTMPRLKRLRLGGCSNITADGMEELHKSRPEISVEKRDDEWEKG